MPIMTPQEHYEHVLARHYTWMFGVPFERKTAEQAALLRQAGVTAPGLAVDLGCGPGFQSIALAEIGASRVHAVDTSAELMSELKARIGGRAIIPHIADLMTFADLLERPADTIVCMGDTLTHLPSIARVTALFASIAGNLGPAGRLVLSWRDLSTPPAGLDRFIPLRADDDRLMLCFLEDNGETVLVHDLVHVHGPNGWELQKSAYAKLKLSLAWVRQALAEAGLTPIFETVERGMTLLAASR